MQSPTLIAEFDRLSGLCSQLQLPADGGALSPSMLERLARSLGAESAAYRSLTLQSGHHVQMTALQNLGVPAGVAREYRSLYRTLDPVCSLLPLLLDPERHSRSVSADSLQLPDPDSLLMSEEGPSAGELEFRRRLRRYREEFLLPNDLYHHVGFMLRHPGGHRVWVFNFHRPAASPSFSGLEQARARLLSVVLQGQANLCPQQALPALFRTLSCREREICQAASRGLSNKQLAEHFGLSVRTVENHLRNIYGKLGISSRTRLQALFTRH